MSREISIEEQLAPYVEKLHAEMRAVFGIPGMSLGSPEAKRMLKEVKKDVEAGPACWTANGYTIVNGYGDPVAVATPNAGVDLERFQQALAAAVSSGNAHAFLTGAGGNDGSTVAYRQDFPPEGKTLMSKSCPVDCICSKHKGKTGIVSTVKRIGDAERDACLALLEERHVSGHLLLDEFQARSDKALLAKNQQELDYLTQDLPALPVVKPKVIPEPHPAREVTVFLCRLASTALPVMAAITIMMSAGLVSAAALAILGGLAALLLTFLQLRP